MATGTVRLHRIFRCEPERIYQAFLDPRALAKWLPPDGFVAAVDQLEARVGGRFRMAFTHLASGHSHAFWGDYLELEPGATIRHTDHFDEPGLTGEMVTTVRLRPVPVGTDLTIVQEGVPEAIPVEACHLGWQDSLALLARLVEAEVPA